jgi:hypothetical protein
MRINLLAGPGSGKSTTAAWLFSELKIRHISVELITEYVKSWATQKRQVTTFDQVYLFGKQMQYEYRFLNNGIKNVVTDSPLILSCVYADYYYPEMKLGQHLLEIMHKYESQYPSLNIYLERKDKPYNQEGRYQTYEEAKRVDELVKEAIHKYLPNVHYVDYNDRNGILCLALEHFH